MSIAMTTKMAVKVGLRVLTGILLFAICLLILFRVMAFVREDALFSKAAPQNGSFIQAADVKLYHRDQGPQNKVPLIFIPGTLAWAETWKDIEVPLVKQGHRVITLDLPPFGFSQRPENGLYGPKKQAKRILAFLKVKNISKAILVGHSFGGRATMEALLTNPSQFSALVLLDVALSLSQRENQTSLAGTVFSLPIVSNMITSASFTNPYLTRYGLETMVFDSAIASNQRAKIYKKPLKLVGSTQAITDWARDSLFKTDNTALYRNTKLYSTLNLPTMIIWGREDTVTPLKEGRELSRMIPDAKLVILDEVNHIPHIENPALVVKNMVSFLSQIEAQEAE